MTHCLKKIGLFVVLAMASLSIAAAITDLPVKTVNGRQYHYYVVQPQETVYSLCRRFGITRDELVATNPSVADGLKANQTLLFPVDNGIKNKSVTETATYMVQGGDTGYGISRRFGMSVDEFYKLNPEAVSGLKAGQYVKVKRAASSSSPVVSESSDKRNESGYTIRQGETLYQIAVRNGISLGELLAANPGLNADNYQAGTVINIPASTSERSAKAVAVPSGKYVVKQGDTFYGIAHAHGMGTDQLRAANPNIEVLQPEMVINLPQACSDGMEQAKEIRQEADPVTAVAPDAPTIVQQVNSDTLVIALALPLNASATVRDARSTNSVEFYRGFVLAVDSMRNYGRPLKILTYDTEGSEDKIRQILADPALRSANVIVAPDMQNQLTDFAKFASSNGSYLLNLFVIKDELYKSNPYIMHSNIPHDAMYRKAIKYFLATFPDVTPVFLKRTGGKTDKVEYVDQLKKALSASGRKYHEIEFNDKLSAATLSKLPAGVNYAFIPVSSSVNELNRLISGINKYKEERTDGGSVALWGYAEWLTARGETLESLHKANSYIFSRFYSVEKDFDQDNLQDAFQRWYGVRIVDKVPRQGTYGFDTGMFLINALNSNNGDFSRPSAPYDGIQNAFRFERVPGGGLINDEMFMINFGPSASTFKFGI
jgi:LysM repeat protein